MELWLVRHGTTVANLEGRFQGRRDFQLSEQGRREAELLSRRLKRCGDFELLLSSDLLRAWETAVIISRSIELRPVREPLLRECSWGFIEGMLRSEVKTAYPFLFCSGSGKLKTIRCGGESARRLLARTRALRQKICRRYSRCRRVLLISHGRLINAFIAGCLGLSSRQRWPFAPAPASLSIVRSNSSGTRCSLIMFNDSAHLCQEDGSFDVKGTVLLT